MLLNKARQCTCHNTRGSHSYSTAWQQSFPHLVNPFHTQLNAGDKTDELNPEGGRADWEQTVRTSCSFEAAVSPREQCFMEMSLSSFAALPAYWCLYRGTVDRLLVAGQTDVNLSSEDAPVKRTKKKNQSETHECVHIYTNTLIKM